MIFHDKRTGRQLVAIAGDNGYPPESMKNLLQIRLLFSVLAFWLIFLSSSNVVFAGYKTRKLLVVTVTKGFKHQSIPAAEKVIEQLGKDSKTFTVDFARTDEDLASKMTVSALKNYDGVLFASTTGELPLPDKEGFLNWIKTGKAFIGIHAATDTFHNYFPFIEMIGGEFLAHGPQLKVNLLVDDAGHPATKDIAGNYEIFDEIYIFKNFNRNKVHTLLSLDKNPNKNDKENFEKGGYYPIAWCHKYGKGKVFYTALGHRDDVLQSDMFKKHLLGGIKWAFKQAKGSASPQIK